MIGILISLEILYIHLLFYKVEQLTFSGPLTVLLLSPWLKCAGDYQEPKTSLTFYTQTLITSKQVTGVNNYP